MKNSKLTATLACSLFLIAPATADTFVLKDGTEIEGELLSENELTYILEIQVTDSIKDERVVPKQDVERIEKVSQDLEDYEAIKQLVPTPDGLDADQYQQRIGSISQFMKRYPSSPMLDQTKDMLAVLRRELSEVEAGGVKLSGMIYTAEDRRMNAYEMDARILAAEISRLLAAGEILAGLRKFESFDAQFQLTPVYDRLVPSVIAAMKVYAGDITRMARGYNARVADRQDGLKSMSSQDRRASERAIADQQKALSKHFDRQRAAKVDWVSPHPFCRQSLDYTVDFAAKRIKALEVVLKTSRPDGGEMYRQGMQLAKGGADADAMGTVLREAQRARMPQSYIDRLTAAATASKPDEKD